MNNKKLATSIRHFIERAQCRGTRYDCTVAEVFEGLLDELVAATGAARPDIAAAIKADTVLRDHPMLRRHVYADSASVMEGGYQHNTLTKEQQRADAINRETTRVLDEISAQLKRMLVDGSYKHYSNPLDNEYMAAVSVKYPVAAAAAVEFEVQLSYQKRNSQERLHRPYLTSMHRYNVRQPLRIEPKRAFCTTFYFHFVENPELVVVPATPNIDELVGEMGNLTAVPLETMKRE